ncbi:unnamed protein product [Urochloa humidicola]
MAPHPPPPAATSAAAGRHLPLPSSDVEIPALSEPEDLQICVPAMAKIHRGTFPFARQRCRPFRRRRVPSDAVAVAV